MIKKYRTSIWCLLLFALHACGNEEPYEFAVVGAGPAGISAVVTLLSNGVSGTKIAWIDPEFSVGRIGKYYGAVPSNTKVKSCLHFIRDCMLVISTKRPLFRIDALKTDASCDLGLMIEPLQWVSDQLRQRVVTVKGLVSNVATYDDGFQLRFYKRYIEAKKLILASGSTPKKMHMIGCKEIALEVALDPALLASQVTPQDTVAVFGASHSGILVLKNLAELSVKKIINFYTKPLVYAVDMGTWYLHNDTGLKEKTAHWAKNVLEKKHVGNLVRYQYSPENVQRYMPLSTKVIYAIGFEPVHIAGISPALLADYNPHTGIIAPRLFGIGIAFPEVRINPFNQQEKSVGIADFMHYAQRVVPAWIKS